MTENLLATLALPRARHPDNAVLVMRRCAPVSVFLSFIKHTLEVSSRYRHGKDSEVQVQGTFETEKERPMLTLHYINSLDECFAETLILHLNSQGMIESFDPLRE